MRKPAKAKAASVEVVLLCTYSATDVSRSPGEKITVDAAEADRLVALGAAVKVQADI